MKIEWRGTFHWNRTFRIALGGGRDERSPPPEPKPIGASPGYRPFPPLRPPAQLDECYFTLVDNGRDVVFDEIYAVEYQLQDIGPDYDRILTWQQERWTFRSHAKHALARTPDPRATREDLARLEAMNDARGG